MLEKGNELLLLLLDNGHVLPGEITHRHQHTFSTGQQQQQWPKWSLSFSRFLFLPPSFSIGPFVPALAALTLTL